MGENQPTKILKCTQNFLAIMMCAMFMSDLARQAAEQLAASARIADLEKELQMARDASAKVERQ